jgi:hypothetical protein
MSTDPRDQLIRVLFWLAEHEPDRYHAAGDVGDVILDTLTELRADVTRKQGVIDRLNALLVDRDNEIERLQGIGEAALAQSHTSIPAERVIDSRELFGGS